MMTASSSRKKSFARHCCHIILWYILFTCQTSILSPAASTVECAIHTNSSNSDKTVTITFSSQVTIQSDPIPLPPRGGSKSLRDFFLLPSTPALVLRGSKDNSVTEILDPEPSLREAYRRRCRDANASAPSPHDRFFEVVSASGVNFPGLQIKSRSVVGGKLISVRDGRSGRNWPCYEFVLIEGSVFASGAKLLVWSFDKIMGNAEVAVENDGDRNKGNNNEYCSSVPPDSDSQTTTSLNRVRALSLGDGNMAFESNASLGVQMNFPAWMMKMIPFGKERSERSGNDSLRKALEQDVPPSLSRLRDAYSQWLEV